MEALINNIFKLRNFLAVSGLGWASAYVLSKSENSPLSFGDKVCATLLTPWYNSFKVSKIVAQQTGQSSWKHTMGKLLMPNAYSGYQLAKLNNSNISDGEKALAIIFGPAYTLYGSAKYSARTANPANPASSALNLYSSAPPRVTPRMI